MTDTTLPVPPEFAFQWQSPDQALQFWTDGTVRLEVG
jgi:hypothetical protein